MQLNNMRPLQLSLILSIGLHLAVSKLLDTPLELPKPEIVKLGVTLKFDKRTPILSTPIEANSVTPLTSKSPERNTKVATKNTPAAPRFAKKQALSPAKQAKLSTANATSLPLSTKTLEDGISEPMQSTPTTPNQSAAISKNISTHNSKIGIARSQHSSLAPNVDKEENSSPPQFKLGSFSNPRPEYPKMARNRGWQGDVIIGVHVNADGSVKSLEILKSSNYSPLDYSAWQTVKTKWTFKPAEHEGAPVPSFVEVPVSFRLSENF
jgi:TonB family protein